MDEEGEGEEKKIANLWGKRLNKTLYFGRFI